MVVAAIALIFAVAGTAFAGPDGITRALTSSKVKKIATKRVNKLAPGIANQEITKRAPNLSVATAANAGTAANANALEGAALAEIAAGRSTRSAFCPIAATFVDCASVQLDVSRPHRLLLVAYAEVQGIVNTSQNDFVRCLLEVDDSGISLAQGNSGIGNTGASGTQEAWSVISLTAVTGVLPAGQHRADLSCRQLVGNPLLNENQITAVALGAG